MIKRPAAFMDSLTDALMLGIARGMATGFWGYGAPAVTVRRRRTRRRSFPAGFKSREAWLAWCEEDRRAEVAEQFESFWLHKFGVAPAEAA